MSMDLSIEGVAAEAAEPADRDRFAVAAVKAALLLWCSPAILIVLLLTAALIACLRIAHWVDGVIARVAPWGPPSDRGLPGPVRLPLRTKVDRPF